MSSSFSYLLLPFVTLIWSALGATCQPRALSLPFKSYPLITKAEARGVLWEIGGPTPQNITLMPSAWYNDTYLWGQGWGFCPSWTSAASCATYRGGLYDRSISGTEKDVANLVPHTFDETVANWTRDDIRLQDNTSLTQYEFALRTNSINPFVHKGELGLGRGSTFLNNLVDGKKISSKSYSFFWGNEVTKEPRDGSLTLGGYDQALIGDSPNITVPFTRDDAKCKEGFIVTLTGLGLQTSGGATRDVWDGLPDLRVCVIATVSNIMTIPIQYWDPIETTMGVERYPYRNGTAETHYWNTTIIKPQSGTYSGNMSVTINNALTVTIPNNQLLFDEHFIASSGLVQSKTDVKQIPMVRIPTGDGAMPRLGGMFFSSAYLMVNHDRSEFTIAQVQSKLAPQKIMAFDTANNCVAALVAEAASTTPGAPTQFNSGSESADTNSSAISGGAIAGIVVGVIFGIALIAGIAFLLWRRKRTAASPSSSEIEGFGVPPSEKYRYHASEMYVDGTQHELEHEDDRQFAVELDGSGRPIEVPEHGSGHGLVETTGGMGR